VGAAFHGIPRSPGDIDFFIRRSSENADRLVRVLQQFGFGSDIKAEDFLKPDRIIQLGIDPYRIDIINTISGVTFEEAWEERVKGEIDGVPASCLTLRLPKRNKLAAGRPKDLADLDALGE
jgi:hypothetical protein